jgi:soluble lytic murein transglycosylase
LPQTGRKFLEVLSLNPDFYVSGEMVDAAIASRPGLAADPGATNDALIRRMKKFFDASLLEEGQVELLLNDRGDLPFCLAMTRYFDAAGYSYLQIKYAERAHRLLQTGFPAYRVRHPLVASLYPEWYRKEVLTLSHRWNLAPSLVYAIIREESRFRFDALSRSGASGLMQLMPSTFSYIMRKKADPETPGAITSPAANIFAGTAFLKDLLQRYGNEFHAVAAYNAGPANVDKWLRRSTPPDDAYFVEFIPFPETRGYVKKVRVSKLGYER